MVGCSREVLVSASQSVLTFISFVKDLKKNSSSSRNFKRKFCHSKEILKNRKILFVKTFQNIAQFFGTKEMDHFCMEWRKRWGGGGTAYR